jgi:hypothetical protein
MNMEQLRQRFHDLWIQLKALIESHNDAGRRINEEQTKKVQASICMLEMFDDQYELIPGEEGYTAPPF